MRIDPKIRETLDAIAKKSIEQANTADPDYKYLRRILRVFDKHLTEEEKVFVFKTVFDLIHYRNVMVDPDNLLVLSNIKLRTYVFIFILSVLAMVIGAILFKTNSTLNGVVELFARFLKLFSL